jgi:trehalose 6-phosphate phosphatase
LYREWVIVANSPPWPRRPALFLDLDGTLLEIAEEPGAVVASDRLKALLGRLPAAVGGALAVISGRRIADVDRLLAPHRFPVAGVHGLERRDARGEVLTHAGAEHLTRVRERLVSFAAARPGLLIEDKTLSLALHYRKRPELEPEIHAFGAALAAELPPALEQLRGRKVIEIKPKGMDKGRAIEAFMGETPFEGREPVFVGDDVTDEAGFGVVNAMRGVSVKVRSGDTRARWRLAGVDAVLEWLERALSERVEALGDDDRA